MARVDEAQLGRPGHEPGLSRATTVEVGGAQLTREGSLCDAAVDIGQPLDRIDEVVGGLADGRAQVA